MLHVGFREALPTTYMSDMRRKGKVWLYLHACLRFYAARKSIIIFWFSTSIGCRNSLITLVNIPTFQHVIDTDNYANVPY